MKSIQENCRYSIPNDFFDNMINPKPLLLKIAFNLFIQVVVFLHSQSESNEIYPAPLVLACSLVSPPELNTCSTTVLKELHLGH